MQIKPQITFRDVKHSPEVEAHIHSNISKIERFSSHLVSCQVVISSDGHHQKDDSHYQQQWLCCIAAFHEYGI